MTPITPRAARIRILTEFIEMPALKLSQSQIVRLCALPEDICHQALASLVKCGLLCQMADGSFGRCRAGQSAVAARGPRSLAATS